MASRRTEAPGSQGRLTAVVTLYFFERITADDFVGPVIVAAANEAAAWTLLARREGRSEAGLRDDDWQIAQELAAIPARPGIVYPSHYRGAVIV
jgi:hypothetical protein